MRFVFDHQLVSDFAKRFYPFFMRIKRFLSVLCVRYPHCRRFDLAPQSHREERTTRTQFPSPGSQYLFRHGHQFSLSVLPGKKRSVAPDRGATTSEHSTSVLVFFSGMNGSPLSGFLFNHASSLTE